MITVAYRCAIIMFLMFMLNDHTKIVDDAISVKPLIYMYIYIYIYISTCHQGTKPKNARDLLEPQGQRPLLKSGL